MAGAPTYRPMVAWVYDTMLWLFSVLVDLFFREVHPRGSWKVPKRGAVILVAAPHANQFVDSLILMRVVRRELQRRIAFLIAEKSFRRKFIGILARASGAVPVSRAMDNMKPGRGTIYLPDPINNPTVLRGIGTNFENPEFQVGGTITLPTVNGQAASTDISEIRGPEEIILKKPFRTRDAIYQLTGRHDITTDGRVTGEASHHDNSNFKEGGSHDRPDLLPLKAGVALMALGALAENPECSVKIVPCGMNYFHAHKFRSRAVIEFGNPIEVPPELVQMYRDGHRREAVGSLLSTIYQALVSVTVTSTDYETLMLIQAARRLYNPTGKKLPLPVVVELNRRLVKGYEHYKDDPKIIEVKKSVMEYNKQLWLLGIRDHQVEYAKFSILKVVTTLIYRLVKLAVMTIATLPGLILFAPVFVATKTISIKKSREALAASSVKIQGRDVMATWKLLVALAFAPLLYAFYTAVLTYWTHYNRVQGYVPQWVSLWLVVAFGFIFFPSVTFAALRVGEVGMDIIKSLRPLVLSLNPTSANTLHKLRIRRQELSENVTSLINTFGPELYPDFDATRIVADPFKETFFTDDSPVKPKPEIVEPQMDGENSNADDHLPRNESFHDLANIGFFSTRPPSRDSHSRTSSSGGLVGSAGFPVKALTTLDSKESFAEVTKRIRGAMRERGRRRRKSEDSGWSMASSGSVSPVRMESLKQR
ncbi:Glycerol-3-phosphate/dihydroxyacetone phosphate acyltransferase [Ophidiomyces ophidiicola]|nr:Glycerol-3-phosphate/dihydroxyacetone phosphate acyltransferase [Ophidiomyces ophidiicola]